MCGPSSALKAINNNIQDFARDVKSEASQVFDASSSVFNKIMDSVTGILKGGPSQYGFSAGEQAAKVAAATNAGATEARNLRGAAAATAGAFGGGNVATPAGVNQAAVLSANQKAAADTAAATNAITQEGYATGRENFWNATKVAEAAPGVFDASTKANSNVIDAQKQALTSQQNIDTQSDWWKSDLMKIGSVGLQAGAAALTGGASAALTAGLKAGSQVLSPTLSNAGAKS